MPKTATIALAVGLCLGVLVLPCPGTFAVPLQDTSPQPAKAVSCLGTVESIDGRSLTVKSDAGVVTQVKLAENARLVRIEPGQKSLAGATALSLTDLQVGDRVLARGSQDGNELSAGLLVAMKKADIEQKQEQERADWQKNGVGGLVKSVDAAAGTVTISTGMAGTQTLTIQTSKDTVVRRYAAGSVRFDQAKIASLEETKPGDQLRARGTRSADGGTLEAQEMISGSFRNIAGSITAVNAASSAITLADLATKKSVTILITPDSTLKKLDPAIAQRIAMRMKKGAPAHPDGRSGPPAAGSAAGPPSGGPAPDPERILAHAPSISLADLQKGDVVMLVATEGQSPGSVTAVTLLSGVEPMLETSASGSQAMLSSAWNLGAPGGGEPSE